jgi:glycyl-tRNA synthetase
MPTDKITMEMLVSIAKRRGFVFQTSEIYGGIAGFYDFGPYGSELVKNIRDAWWRSFVYAQPNIVGLDTAIIQNPGLWKASGHVDTFVDPLVDCKNCQHRFRADHLVDFETNDLKRFDEALKSVSCPNCGKDESWTPVRQFNMMFKTHVGPVVSDDNMTYLRPETAGGIFAQFLNVVETSRQKLPFGIAQIGKAFRNEITPGDFIFRVREFEQMELEYFVDPKDAESEYKRWKKLANDWLLELGLDETRLKYYDHSKDEKAHYAASSVDIQYEFPMGFRELYGIANRTDYDLVQQSKFSGKELSIFDEVTKERITPYVIEPSIGISRLFLALLHSAYYEEEVNNETRVVLKFKPVIAPIKVAVLPLSKNDKLTPLAKEVFSTIAGTMRTEYDETQSIGRRYRRQDEIGTPLCVTVDFDSLDDGMVTIRHRDTMKQDRVKIKDLKQCIDDALKTF